MSPVCMNSFSVPPLPHEKKKFLNCILNISQLFCDGLEEAGVGKRALLCSVAALIALGGM